jgi:hypothetical protein
VTLDVAMVALDCARTTITTKAIEWREQFTPGKVRMTRHHLMPSRRKFYRPDLMATSADGFRRDQPGPGRPAELFEPEPVDIVAMARESGDRMVSLLGTINGAVPPG